MSPSSDRRSRGRDPLVLTVGLAALGGVWAPPVVAAADATAQVITIVAPVLDIQLGVADLDKVVRVESLPTRTTFTLDATVLFLKDSATVTSSARGRLSEVTQTLNGQGPGSVRVTGYTDDLGTAAHGRTLSRQRAAAVATVLGRALDPSSFRFTVVGQGEADPAVPNTSEANRRINRRVVVVHGRR